VAVGVVLMGIRLQLVTPNPILYLAKVESTVVVPVVKSEKMA